MYTDCGGGGVRACVRACVRAFANKRDGFLPAPKSCSNAALKNRVLQDKCRKIFFRTFKNKGDGKNNDDLYMIAGERSIG